MCVSERSYRMYAQTHTHGFTYILLQCSTVSICSYLLCVSSLNYFSNQESLGEEVLRMSNDEVISRTRLLDNEIKVRI